MSLTARKQKFKKPYRHFPQNVHIHHPTDVTYRVTSPNRGQGHEDDLNFILPQFNGRELVRFPPYGYFRDPEIRRSTRMTFDLFHAGRDLEPAEDCAEYDFDPWFVVKVIRFFRYLPNELHVLLFGSNVVEASKDNRNLQS